MLHLNWKPACLHSRGDRLRRTCLPTSTTRAKHAQQLPFLERWLDKKDRRVALDHSPAVPAAVLSLPTHQHLKPNETAIFNLPKTSCSQVQKQAAPPGDRLATLTSSLYRRNVKLQGLQPLVVVHWCSKKGHLPPLPSSGLT